MARFVNTILQLPKWKEDGERKDLLKMCCSGVGQPQRSPGRACYEFDFPEPTLDLKFDVAVILHRVLQWQRPVVDDCEQVLMIQYYYKFDSESNQWVGKLVRTSKDKEDTPERKFEPVQSRVDEECENAPRRVIRTEIDLPKFPYDWLKKSLDGVFMMDHPDTGLFIRLYQSTTSNGSDRVQLEQIRLA